LRIGDETVSDVSWVRKLVWLPVLGVGLTACALGAGDSIGQPSDEAAYLESVSDVQAGVEDGFDRVGEALASSYNTREVLFSAIRDVGYQEAATSALTLAEAIVPPEEFSDEHERWLAHRRLAVDKATEIAESIEVQDLQAMFAVFTALDQDWASIVASGHREFCLAVSQSPTFCPAPDDLPGGAYGAEVYEELRLNSLANLGLFSFFEDMSPQERSIRLEQVQPHIEANLIAGAEAMRDIDPPDEYETEHQVLIRYFDEQYANAVGITKANAEGDDAAVSQLFTASGAAFESALTQMSTEFRIIAAPWIGPESNN